MWTAGAQSPEPAWWPRLQPMPVSAFDAAVELTGSAAQLPGWFVHCLKSDFADQAARGRARGWTVIEVDGVHALPLADPATCVQILLRLHDSIWLVGDVRRARERLRVEGGDEDVQSLRRRVGRTP